MPHTRPPSLAVLSLGLAVLLLSGCPGPQPTVAPAPTAQATGNLDPAIEYLYAETAGRRVRVVRPGMTVTVRARATDRDHDPLDYRWRVGPGSGRLEQAGAAVVRWTPADRAGRQVLFLVVSDGRGGTATRELVTSRDAAVVFAGAVVTADSQPVDGAQVDVNGDVTSTGADGRFRLPAGNPEAERFVFSIRKEGFGLVSRIYDAGVDGGRWTLPRSTTASFDPARAIVARDVAQPGGCLGTASSRIDWTRFPRQRIARAFDRWGEPFTGPVPPGLSQALAALSAANPCSPGVTLSVPPGALVDGSGTAAAGSVLVSLSTVDLRAPDAMPGDFTVRTAQGTRSMQSYGAATVTASQNGRPLALAPGRTATLTIPVDPVRREHQKQLDSVIPFLRYDEATGDWVPDGTARLNAARDAYVADVAHFSAFNMDLLKTDQACVRIESSAMAGDYQLEITIPTGAGPDVRTRAVDNTPEAVHVLYNLPTDLWIGLVPIREDPPGTLTPLGTFVVNTGPPQVPTDPNRPDYPYGACQSRLSLFEVPDEIHVVENGAGRVYGPRPAHFFALVDPSTGDIYPTGSGDRVLFSLFDTGSTRLIINALDPATDANPLTGDNFGDSDAGHLGLAALATVHVRLNGLARRDDAGSVPIGPPGALPEAEVQNVTAEPRNTVDVSLMGSPITQNVVAVIDNTVTITDPPTGVTGPDMRFYLPGDPGIPQPDLWLTLERWGVPQRFLLRDVAFEHGGNVVRNQDPPNPIWFLFDTGAPPTIVNDAVATALGLTPGTGAHDCFAPGDRKGHQIDAITATGLGGSYRVAPAVVCWDQSRIQAAILSGVIGLNLFGRVPIVVDGPGNRLGIILPPGSQP